MSNKIRVGLVFGGRSGEHEVSLMSAKSIYEALDKDKYEVVLIGVDKEGKWHLGEGSSWLLNENNPKLIALNKAAPEVVPVGDVGRVGEVGLVGMGTKKPKAGVEVFFPIIHGSYGEDGCIQGMFELLDAAYVGAGVLGSAVGMDKAVMKRLLLSAGLPVAPFIALTKKTPLKIVEKWSQSLGLRQRKPIFVKPANMGSSVGVSKVHNKGELRKAMNEAFEYDTKILLEEFIEGRELECSVLGNPSTGSGRVLASVAGEVVPHREFYSYEAKYIDENGARLEIPAKLSKKKMKEVQGLAVEAFQALSCNGMARVDMFMQPDGKLVINEINTLPGFTKISMYPKLWEASGLPYPKLLDNLIGLAIEKKKEKNGLKRSYI